MSDTSLAALRAALAARYDVSKELGRGGMAVVYLARDLKHNREVAVKVLHPEVSVSLGAERFLKEIEIAAGLSHPHILPLHDSGDADGILYYVMPYVAGPSLRRRLIERRVLQPDEAIGITREVASALGYAHRHGVVHRDVKPENILLSEGHAVVADFGIAKAMSIAGVGRLTRTGFPIGTPGYMSPEQAAGQSQLDARSDVFSLACVHYEMVVGDPPGMWVSPEAAQMLRFVDATPAHRERLDLLPGAVEQALVMALMMKPADRFESPADFARAVEEAMRSPRPRYTSGEVRQIIGRAADIQADRPTEGEALSLASVQRVAAEVGIPPGDVQRAVRDGEASESGALVPGGFFGVSQRIALERLIPVELPEAEFEGLLEEIRHTMGEVGRLNQTLGKSLSWNSLSFQNSVEGGGRLMHVMINPRDGHTRIRITESPGQHGPVLGVAMGIGGVVSFMVLAKMGVVALGPLVGFAAAVAAAGSVVGGVYLGGRLLIRRMMKRRVRQLAGLMDRLTAHAADSGQGVPPAQLQSPATEIPSPAN